MPEGRSYAMPLAPGEIVPRVPPDGFRLEEEVARLSGARRIDAIGAPGPALDTYVFERRITQRNLYREFRFCDRRMHSRSRREYSPGLEVSLKPSKTSSV